MDEPKFPPFFPILITGFVIAAVGWLGLAAVILFLDPELGPRWLMHFMFFLGISGLALPLVAYLNRRFPGSPPAGEGVLVRQSIWVGIYGSLLAWLQQGRVLNLALVLFLALGFILIEILIRLSERSRWKPQGPENE